VETMTVARFKTNVDKLILRKSAQVGKRLTHEDVSVATGLSVPTIGRWARSEVARLELKTIKRLCDYFECTFEELVVFEPDDDYDTPHPDGD
jgi:DNA-binding Xre family transcriptional regulator